MSLTITCPGCRDTGQVPDDALGKRARCKDCGMIFIIEQTLVVPPQSSPPANDKSQTADPTGFVAKD